MSLMRLVSLALAMVYGGNDEREQTLNQLLTEMDGFAAAGATVIVLAATNRESLDTALCVLDDLTAKYW